MLVSQKSIKFAFVKLKILLGVVTRTIRIRPVTASILLKKILSTAFGACV